MVRVPVIALRILVDGTVVCAEGSVADASCLDLHARAKGAVLRHSHDERALPTLRVAGAILTPRGEFQACSLLSRKTAS